MEIALGGRKCKNVIPKRQQMVGCGAEKNCVFLESVLHG